MLCHFWLFRLTLRNYILSWAALADFSMALKAFALLSCLLPFWTLALDMPAENSWYLGQKSNNSATQTYPRLCLYLCVCVYVLKRFTQLRSSLDMHMRIYVHMYVCMWKYMRYAMYERWLVAKIYKSCQARTSLRGNIVQKGSQNYSRSSMEFAPSKYFCCGSPFHAFASKLRRNSH